MKFIFSILANVGAILLGAKILDCVTIVGNAKIFLVSVVIILLNTFVRPILVVLTIPATILTLGLFLLVINGIIIMIADHFLDEFAVTDFWCALWFSLILSIVNGIADRIFKKRIQKK